MEFLIDFRVDASFLDDESISPSYIRKMDRAYVKAIKALVRDNFSEITFYVDGVEEKIHTRKINITIMEG